MAEGETGAADRRRRPRRPDQLAGGPHGMSREQVETNQTSRILTAMSELIAEHGYERTTVKLVISRAGVSRKTFYDLRGGREQWFVVICEAAGDQLLARVDAACAANASPAERAQRAAATLVDFCLDDPASARACFVETLAASDRARAWREALLDDLARTIARAAAANGDRRAEQAARAAIGAVIELAGRAPERLDRHYATALVAGMLASGGETGGAIE